MPNLFILLTILAAAPVDMPRVLDDRLQLELICQNPDVVTPIGLTIDAKGRLLVVESHTHFPPKDYAGPPHDRILLIDPREGLAKRIFFEGSKRTMSIARAPDGSIYVGTRNEIFRLRDTDGDDKADEVTSLVNLKTAGNYPHNGLCGITFPQHEGAGTDEFRFGCGENLGEDYELVGSDGSKLVGGGEGGNVFACRLDGSKLRRVATGVWNPFAMTFDLHGNLFVVDNDPDSRPPCRLLHVVEGGNYGFQFRHGRKGTHPFTAWNGELPGTLPMVCGTGEAPSAVIRDESAFDEKRTSHEAALLVTSWGDHRIERYQLEPRGQSFTAVMQPLVIGGENFRPVGMAGDLDSGLYFTDWVDKSYQLHGRGRIWKLSIRQDDAVSTNRGSFATITQEPSKLSDAEQDAALRKHWQELVAKNSANPFEWQSAAQFLTERQRTQTPLNDDTLPKFRADFLSAKNTESIIWAAVGARDANPANVKPLVPYLLNHDEPRVRLLGVMWVGNDGLTEFRDDIVKGLSRPGLTRELFECSLAALEMLEPKQSRLALPVVDNKRKNSGDYFAIEALRNPDSSTELKRFALKTLPPNHAELKFDLLKQLAADADPQMRIEAIRTIRERPFWERSLLLKTIAADPARTAADRVEAIIGLDPQQPMEYSVVKEAAHGPEPEVARAAQRFFFEEIPIAVPAGVSAAGPARITSIPSGGDAAAGERLFFHPRMASCYRCHEYAGRGAKIGPDLTTIHRTATREKILQSILDPSREIGPSFVPWLIETTDGRTLTGLYVGEEVNGQHRYADPAGKIFLLYPTEIEHREAAKQSIMPADLGKTLTDDALRDLAAFLLKAN